MRLNPFRKKISKSPGKSMTKSAAKNAAKKASGGRRLVRAAVILALMVGVAGAGWHATRANYLARLLDSLERGIVTLTVQAGLTVQDVLVEGRTRTATDTLLAALGVQVGDPILAIDIAAMRARVEGLPWVKQAEVVRRLPGVLVVHLAERHPLALWQRNQKLSVVDYDGKLIAGVAAKAFPRLPILVGEEAPARARELLAMLAAEPDLSQRVRAATWVGGRRWDVRIDDRIDIQLPEDQPRAAWAWLAKMEREQGLLERDVITIDMRLGGQLVVRLAPGAAERRRKRGKGQGA